MAAMDTAFALRVDGQRFERKQTSEVDYVTAADGTLFVTTDVGRFEGEDTAELVVLSSVPEGACTGPTRFEVPVEL